MARIGRIYTSEEMEYIFKTKLENRKEAMEFLKLTNSGVQNLRNKYGFSKRLVSKQKHIVDEIIKKYNSGLDTYSISADFEISYYTTRKILNKNGIYNRRPKLNENQIKRALEMRNRGIPRIKIAKFFGVGDGVIERIFKNVDINNKK